MPRRAGWDASRSKDYRMKLVRWARRHVPMAAFLAPFVLAAVLLSAWPSGAQQMPLDSLQQLQQQIQGRGGLNTGANDQQQQPVTLRPAVPAAQPMLPQSRLEMILSARAHVKLTQFGYDQLGTGRPVTIPQAGAIQGDYVLGPGDEVAVSLRGQENNEFRVNVDRNGQIVLPRLKPIPAMGRTLDDVRQDIQQAVGGAYVATTASVAVARVRQITVLMSGEINSAGPRLVTGLSSVIDALVLSGGVKKTGSLRDIQVRRGGRIFTVDLYGALTGIGRNASLRLADGDQIVVPPLGKTVAVAGLVRRPGIYELPPGRSALSVRDLIELTGGHEVRGSFRMSVLRVLPDGRTSLTPLTGTSGQVQDSEVLFVQLAADQTVSQATLAGGTGLAGSYPVTTGTHLADLLKAPGALGVSPYTPFGIIVRKNPQTLMRHLLAFTPVAVLNGREDQVLQTDDMIRVLSVREERLLNYVVRTYLSRLAADMNQIRNPLSAAQGGADSLIDAIANKGSQDNELQDLSGVPADLQRQEINNLLGMRAPDSPTEQQFLETNQRLARTAQQRRLLAGAGEPAVGLAVTGGEMPFAGHAAINRKPLLVAATQAPGCPLDLEEISINSEGVTYHNRISRILQARCLECHREGGAAPFSLESYDGVVAQSASIRQAIERGVMPPWFAAMPEKGQPSHWANDKSLAESEKGDLLFWLSHGKPAGRPEDAPVPREFPEGWRIGQPDLIVQLPAAMPVKASGVMPYQDVIVETGLTEDKWVRAMEIRPTAPEVVHHVLAFLLPPANRSKPEADRRAGDDEAGGFFMAYAPGHDPMNLSEGFAKKLPAGSRLKFQMHFTPNGTATQDQTRLGMIFTSQEPAHVVNVSGIANPRLSIPPGADNHPITATQTVPADTTIMAFFPHMHLRGKSFKYEAVYADGRTQTLLDVPRYDFNWQLSYRLAEPMELPKGTVLKLTGWYDNSKNNPANPDPTKTVKWGPQTYDEMMIGYVEYYTSGSVESALSAIPNLEATFRSFDRNSDGKLSDDEFPPNWKDRLLKLDSNGDQAVTLEEIQQGLRRRRR